MGKHTTGASHPLTFPWTPPSRRRRLLAPVGFGATGLFMFVVCGVTIWVSDGGPRSTSSASAVAAASSPTDTGDDSTETLAAPGLPGLNSVVRNSVLEYVVTGQRCGVLRVGSGGGPAGKPSRGQFCLVTVRVHNLGPAALVFTPDEQIGYTAAGNRYSGSAGGSRYANGSSRTFLTAIGPGASRTGMLAFDLPRDESLTAVRLRASGIAGSVAVRL